MSSASSSPVALVTGSGKQRVGNVIAEYLAERGYRIALHYRSSEAEAFETRDKLRDRGCECEAFRADLGNVDEAESLVDQTVDAFGRVDVLVTTASIWSPIPLDEVTPDDLQQNFAANTLGTFYPARAAGRVMAAQAQGGSIITIGDTAIDRPYAGYAAYFISKGAVPTLTKALAVEFAERNPRVRVNCIQPGPVMFPAGLTDAEKQAKTDRTLLKQANQPETVAHAVEFLINNPFVTGACIPVDAGQHLAGGGAN